jgi:hypothetical protein
VMSDFRGMEGTLKSYENMAGSGQRHVQAGERSGSSREASDDCNGMSEGKSLGVVVY